MPKRGGFRKKRRTHVPQTDDATKGVPKCFVIKRGNVSHSIRSMVHDWRQLMSPYCALKLKESPHNKLKDFVSVSSVFGLTHLIMFSQTERSAYMKLARLPEGPTLTFRITEFSLTDDVRAHQRKSRVSQAAFQTSPLLVMNGFKETQRTVSSDAFPTQLVSTFIGNMFPSINLHTIKTSDCRRVVLFHIDKLTQQITIRHYGLLKRPATLSKGLQKLLRAKNNPTKLLDLHGGQTRELVLNSNNDDEEDDTSDVDANVSVTSSATTEKVALSLYEIGPRLKIELIKVEENVAAGKVLFHRFMSKTEEELAEQAAKEPSLQKKRKLDRDAMEAVATGKDGGSNHKRVRFASQDDEGHGSGSSDFSDSDA